MDFNGGHVSFGVGRPNPGGGGSSGITSINGATGPTVTLLAGYGADSIVRAGNNIYINISGIDLTSSGFATIAQLITSGYTTLSEVRNDIRVSGYELHSSVLASGYVRNVDLVASGYVMSLNGGSGTLTIRAGSGVDSIVRSGSNIFINASGNGVTNLIVQSGLFCLDNILWQYNIASGTLESGVSPEGLCYASGIAAGSGISITIVGTTAYINASGKVVTLNNLQNNVTLVGSGNITTWVDGQTIQITSAGGVTLAQVQADLYTSGYIRNVDFITSGFITKAEVASSGFATRSELTTSGYLKASDRMYPVDARAVSGHIAMNTSGRWDIGADSTRLNNIWANSGIFQSGVSVSGFPIIYQIDSLSGPIIRFDTDTSLAKTTNDHTITFRLNNLSASGFATINQLITSGYTTLSEVRSDLHTSGYIRNTNFVTSGFITKAEVASSGFATIAQLVTSGYTTLAEVRSDLHTSGYIRNTDFISSGFITKAEVAASGFATRSELTTSGYLKASDRMYPVDARAVSGNINTLANTYNIGQQSAPFSQVNAVSGWFTYVRETREVQPLTSGYQLAANESHKVFTNEGTNTQPTYTVPNSSLSGIEYTFVNEHVSGLTVQLNAGQTVMIGPNMSTAGGTFFSTLPGSTIVVVGINSSGLRAISMLGAWSYT